MTKTTDLMPTVVTILNERFGIDREKLTEETRLTDLGIDSMHLVDLMLDLETELGVNFGSLDLPANPSLLDIVHTVRKNIA